MSEWDEVREQDEVAQRDEGDGGDEAVVFFLPGCFIIVDYPGSRTFENNLKQGIAVESHFAMGVAESVANRDTSTFFINADLELLFQKFPEVFPKEVQEGLLSGVTL